MDAVSTLSKWKIRSWNGPQMDMPGKKLKKPALYITNCLYYGQFDLNTYIFFREILVVNRCYLHGHEGHGLTDECMVDVNT